jgi:hypothetical protein
VLVEDESVIENEHNLVGLHSLVCQLCYIYSVNNSD